MYRLILALAILLTGNALFAAGDDSSQFVQDTIRIEADRLVYKGKSAKIPLTRGQLIRVFGAPNREIYNVAGDVLIWDSLGLSCYGCQEHSAEPEEFQYMTETEKKNYQRNNYIGTLTLYARKYNPYPEQERSAAHLPQLPFPGHIRLQGFSIDGTSTITDFLQQRDGEQTVLLPENSFSFFIRCQPEPHEITLHSIRDKYDADYLSIFSVSIRNIGHFYKKVTCLEVFDTGTPPPELEAADPAQAIEPIIPILEGE